MSNVRSQLVDAMHGRLLIRFSRRFENSTIRGYVLDIGPDFFLLALLSDRIWFDGFECFRIRDIRNVKPDPYLSFAEAALRKRRERRPRKPRISVANLETLLRSSGRLFPLVTIHREQVGPDVCWIGSIVAVASGQVSLLEINPDASWDDTPTKYPLRQITRVNFGGDYENALHLVGGNPPAMKRRTT
jgi:hypothetical protein